MNKKLLIILAGSLLSFISQILFADPPRNICHYLDASRYPRWSDGSVGIEFIMPRETPDTQPADPVPFEGKYGRKSDFVSISGTCYPQSSACASIAFTAGNIHFTGLACNGVMHLENDSGGTILATNFSPYQGSWPVSPVF